MRKTTTPPTARQMALQILYDIEVQGAYTDVALREMLRPSALDRRDRAFVTECVYGVVRWQGRIDWMLAQVNRRPLHELTPWIRNALRLGVYQCLWMERVPARAAVYETVTLARRFGHQGTAGLVNGVLRNLLRQIDTLTLPDATTHAAAHLAVAYSHPEWLVTRWLQRYGWERTRALCEVNNRPAAVSLRTNTLRTTPALLAQQLAEEGIQQVALVGQRPEGLIIQGVTQLDTLPSYRTGLFQVQDVGAMLVAPLCQVQPGQRVLDLCAAPGGKTTHLAQLMHDSGCIVACDLQPGRIRLLRNNVARLGCTSVLAVVADGSRPLPVQTRFDRILVDAPCSGFGVLRRHPDIKWRKTPADLATLRALQLRLLQAHHHLLSPGGMLVYSVCSHEPEETHEVVAQFLAAHPHMRLDALDAELPQLPCHASTTPGTLDLTPEQWQTDGVFVARFRWRESSA